MAVRVTDLCNVPQYTRLIADWIYHEFWTDQDVHSVHSLAVLLRQANRPDAIPQSLVALESGTPIGTVNLIENDDAERKHLRPWLAALFVVPEHRRQGVGSLLVRRLRQRASLLGCAQVYLGTDQPDFYRHLGATLHETVTDHFCIMRLTTQGV